MRKCYKKFLVMVLFAVTCLFVCGAQEAESFGVDRYAIYIGSNNGGREHQQLMYAGSDAIAFQKTMKEIGGVPQTNAILLLDPTKDDLDQAIEAISDLIRRKRETSKRSEFLFYYSGHSDENALLLGNATYDYSGLKTAISNVPSDVHVVILDSCYSGNFIRTKGGQKKKPFLLDDSTVVKGHAYLSSSSSQESSQESDEIESSFFTNAMLTGLRGAADSSGDKKVTLNELYSYAFNETLSKTENTSAGPQHPNYNITLVGSGDLVLSDISNSDCVLSLSRDLNGRLIIRTKNGKLISEINKFGGKALFLALEEGDYNATLITDTMTMQGNFSLTSGKVYQLGPGNLHPVSGTFNRLRGGDGTQTSEDDEDDDDDEWDSGTLSEDTMFFPIEFSFVINEITRGFHKKIITPLSISILHSKVYRVNGVMVTLGINEADIINGVQTALVANTAHDLHGVQATCGLNSAHDFNGAQAALAINKADNFKGIQAAGIFNKADNFKGAQVAGIFNRGKEYLGIQGAGIFNVANDFTGGQFAGIFNSAKNTSGIQWAGFVNKADNVSGSQLAGFVNVAKDVHGVQIGLVNVAKDVHGFQFGLVNICDDGIIEIGTSFSSNRNFRLTMNSGKRYLYGMIGGLFSGNFLFDNYDGETRAHLIYGLGTRFQAGVFNFDLQAYRTVYNDSHHEDSYGINFCKIFIPQIRMETGFKPAKNINFFIGLNLIWGFGESNDVYDDFEKNLKIKFDDDFTVYPEIEIGVKYIIK